MNQSHLRFHTDTGRIYSNKPPLVSRLGSEYVPRFRINIKGQTVASLIKNTAVGDIRNTQSRVRIHTDYFKRSFEILSEPLEPLSVGGFNRDVNLNKLSNNAFSNITTIRENYINISMHTGKHFIKLPGSAIVVNNYVESNPTSNTTSYEPLHIECVKREHVRYVKQCMMLGKPVHPDAIKVFVNDKFDCINGIDSEFLDQFNIYKYQMLELGVKFENVPNFDELFTRFKMPKARSVDENTKNMEIIASEALNIIKASNEFRLVSGTSVENI